jgi:thioredoxin reductase (NADPH)
VTKYYNYALLLLTTSVSFLSASEQEDILILGSGPAGLTAAIYAARGGYTPLVIEGEEPGGQLTGTINIENYPGFPEAISGFELTDLMRMQAERFGARFKVGKVVNADISKTPFIITLDDSTVIETKALIIATGASPKMLGLPAEKALKGYGVGTCAVCDGFFFKDKNVVVVGGGDSALEDALYLARLARHVTVIHRRDTFRASKILQKRISENSKISLVLDSVIKEINDVARKQVTSVIVQNLKTDAVYEIPADGVFIAIGHQPNSSLFENQIELDGMGYIQMQPFSSKTSKDGVFAAGDVADSSYRQAVTAAGMGTMAALDALRFLDELGD